MSERVLVCTPWHNLAVRDAFLDAWKIKADDPRLLLREDVGQIGCGAMKNKIIAEAVERGAEIGIVLDSDCLPDYRLEDQRRLDERNRPMDTFIRLHQEALAPQTFVFFVQVTNPRSRGTPHLSQNRCITRPVAASMGYWTEIGDYDAALQLAYGQTHPMEFEQRAAYLHPFALSGMNMAMRLDPWAKIMRFIDVPRYDDIWAGWIFQKIASSQGYCFNLNGPLVRHSRQSNVWQNLREEAKYAELSETLWRTIWEHPSNDYDTLRALIPV